MASSKTIAVIICLMMIGARAAAQVPEKYKDLRWYAAETPNFEIRAMKKSHAILLKDRVEQLKTWVQERWGLRDVPFNKKCMIMCAANEEQFREWWKHDADPKEAISKDRNNNDRHVYAIWIAPDDDGAWLRNTLPEKVGRVCLINYESVHGTEISAWAQVGMSALNNDVNTIARLLQGIDVKNGLLGANTILSVTKKEYAEKSVAAKLEFKQQAVAFTLFMRKEFGIHKFLAFVDSGSGSQRAVRQIYGFETADQFESAYYTYIQNLVHDLRSGATPASYLTWGFVRKKAN